MRRNRIATAVAELAEKLLRPRYLRVVAEFKVHDRRAVLDGTKCPCCKSLNAEIVEPKGLVAADLVIDLVTGERILSTDPDWAKYCELAELHEVPIRCSQKTLPLLLDSSSRHVFLSGGNRAQKTTTALCAMALEILLRGGKERRFWLIASTDAKAFRLLEKLFKGTGESPAILPSALIERAPMSDRASDKLTRLVDGSLIDLKSFHGDPSAERIKSDAVVAALVDEAAHLPSPMSLSALRGRCADVEGGGRLWFASTPLPSSFVTEYIVLPAQEWASLPPTDPRLESGEHPGAAWLFAPLPMVANPWVPLANIQRDMKTLDMTKPENRRDYGGEWVASEGLFWEDKFDPARHMFVHESRDVAKMEADFLAKVGAAGHVVITGEVRKMLFGRANPHHRTIRASNDLYLIGQDVNYNPMESCLVQITAPPDTKKNRDTWHYWAMDNITTVSSNTMKAAERLVSPEMARILDPKGSGLPLVGCGMILDATAIKRVDPHATRHGQTGSTVDTFARVGIDCRAPLYRPSKTSTGHVNGDREPYFAQLTRLLSEGRIHIASRCGPLLNAFNTQLSEPDGKCPLDARSGHWDKVMGPMDAFRYVVYAAANAPAPPIGITSR